MRKKIILAFVFMVLTATALSLLSFVYFGKYLDRDEKTVLFQKGEQQLSNYLESEKIRLENTARDIADDPATIDKLDYGDSKKLNQIAIKNTSEKLISAILFYDFEGDYIAGNIKISEKFSFFIKSQVRVAKLGNFRSGLWVESEEIYLWAAGPVGKLNNPSGITFILKSMTATAIEDLERQTSLRGSFLIGKQLLNINPKNAILDRFTIEKIPRNLASRVPSWIDQFSAEKTYRVSALELSFSEKSEISFLFIIPYPVGKIGLQRLALFSFLSIAILLVLGIPILLSVTAGLVLDFALIRKYVDKFKFLEPDSRSLAGATTKEGAQLFSELSSLVKNICEKVENGDKARVLSERKWRKVADIVSVSPATFKIFMENTSLVRSDYESVIKQLVRPYSDKSPEERSDELKITLGELVRIADTVKNDSILFRQKQLREDALHLEEFLTSIIKNSSDVNMLLADEIQERFQVLFLEIDSYRELRKSVMGEDSLDANTIQISNIQIQWLLSLVSRLFHAFHDPRPVRAQVRRLDREFSEAMNSLGKVDIRFYLDQYDQMLKTRLEKSGKQLHPLEISGTHFAYDEALMPLINHMLIQCIYNGADHGIENQIVRRNQKKDKLGKISIESNLVGTVQEIIIKDDGRGLDSQDLAKKIVEQGLKSEEDVEKMTSQEIIKFVLATGKSEDVNIKKSNIRGVGLNGIHKLVSQLNGSFDVISQLKKGTTVKISIPTTGIAISSQDSLFDARVLLAEILNVMNPILTALSVEVIDKTTDGFFPVFVSKRTLFVACRNIINLLATTFNSDLKMSFQFTAKSSVSYGIELKTTSLIIGVENELTPIEFMKVMQTDTFRETMTTLIKATGFNLQVNPKSSEISIDIVSNIPEEMTQNGIKFLVLSENFEQIEVKILEYAKAEFGNWTVKVCGESQLDEYFELDQTLLSVLIADGDQIDSYLEIQNKLGAPGQVAILVAKELIGVEASRFDSIKGEIIVCKGALDNSSIGRAISRATAKYLN